MTKHKKKVGQYSNMDKLAEDIGNLHYETLELLMSKLSKKLNADAWIDGMRGRKQLSDALFDASKQTSEASSSIGKAFKISEPYMREPESVKGCGHHPLGCNVCFKKD